MDVGWRQMWRVDATICLRPEGSFINVEKNDDSGNSVTAMKRACASLTANLENSGEILNGCVFRHVLSPVL